MTISATQAKGLVLKHSPRLGAETLRLDSGAVGRVLAEALKAPQPSPRWDVSAMDGFAVRAADFPAAYGYGLEILGTAKAGDLPLRLGKQGAIRIMTGALVPSGADAVVPRELSSAEEGCLQVSHAAAVERGDHIRWAGEELKKGEPVASPGTRLNSRWIGFLNGLGLESAKLAALPRASLLVTGSELKAAGQPLKPGQIHDSNGPMLESAFREEGLRLRARRLRDSPQRIRRELGEALASSDLVLLSGGVSVGDADYSKDALKALGVKTIFWGVAQKPGKPLYFGKKGKALVFGLPGNPYAAWVCFREYVAPALEAMQGLAVSSRSRLAMSRNLPRRDARKTLFLKARLEGSKVLLLEGQQSHMLRSLAEANALARLEPGNKGRLLEVSPL